MSSVSVWLAAPYKAAGVTTASSRLAFEQKTSLNLAKAAQPTLMRFLLSVRWCSPRHSLRPSYLSEAVLSRMSTMSPLMETEFAPVCATVVSTLVVHKCSINQYVAASSFKWTKIFMILSQLWARSQTLSAKRRLLKGSSSHSCHAYTAHQRKNGSRL